MVSLYFSLSEKGHTAVRLQASAGSTAAPEEESESDYEEIETKLFEWNGTEYLLDPSTGNVYAVDGENDFVGAFRPDGSVDKTAEEVFLD